MTEGGGGDAAAVVGRYLEAWAAQDIDTVLSLYHEELTLVWHGGHDLAGRHEGRDAAADALLRLQLRTGRTVGPVHRVLAQGDRADAWLTEHWTDGGTDIEVRRLLAFRVADGQLVECEILEADQHLVDDWLAANPGD